MECFVYCFLLSLLSLNCIEISYAISSHPSVKDYRYFAAGNSDDLPTDSCRNKEREIDGKRNEIARRDGKKKEVFAALEKLFPSKEKEPVERPYELHLLTNASNKGAVCLDGSPPGIYFRNGTGSDRSKWIVFFQGGAWCHDAETCSERSSTALGSSKCYRRYLSDVQGLLSSQTRNNPDFYKWTGVYVPYCDGSSFTGNRDKPFRFKDKLLYFRGRRILDAVLRELHRWDIDKATEIILTGSSAGAVSAIIHADYIRRRLRRETKASFRVLADAGVFLDEPSLNGTETMRSIFRQTYKLHNSSSGLNQDCIRTQKRKQKWRCFFAQYSLPYVRSRLFVVNALYDSWQLAIVSGVPCVFDIKNCNSEEYSYIMNFGKKTKLALRSIFDSKSKGVLADSCFIHNQCTQNQPWMNIQVRHVTINKAFLSWYRGNLENRCRVDGYYPWNPTC
ncbi:pectin acetylesterase 7-like [Stylophora pistillata]|uniref:pectin acetylesterase 7-like n=1 Tax=Stylophora pistillata TaxID=50429 RepID=UPI000C0536E6|nr:pectin acetylesterase 7-like [Stylophora pistillata]